MLLGLHNGEVKPQACFNLPTADAQSVLFCPGTDPVIAVWDSPSYGVKIYFFSAMGHPLKALDLVGQLGKSSGLDGVGVSQLSWAKSVNGTVLAVADGKKQILVREQDHQKMSVKEIGTLRHPSTIDGSTAIVWQQTEDQGFALQKGVFDAVQVAGAVGDTGLLELNCDQSFLASSVLDNPNTIWIWQPDHPDPHTIVTFSDQVKSLLWHPKLPNVLAVMTANKEPIMYCWHTETRPPNRCVISMSGGVSSRYEARWSESSIDGKHPFVMTSNRAVNYGFLRPQDGQVTFDSILCQSAFHLMDEDDSSQLLTPSKPAKNKHQVIQDTDSW